MNDAELNKNSIQNLIISAEKGDMSALEAIIKLVQNDIYSSFSHLTCNKDDVADLTQEALLKMAKSLRQLKDVSHFKAWLNQIVVNTFYDYLKKQPKNIIDYDEEKINKLKDRINREPQQRYVCAEIENLIKAALLSLPGELRIAIILREFEGLSYSEISKATNSTLGTVKSRIARARFKLQKQLQEYI